MKEILVDSGDCREALAKRRGDDTENVDCGIPRLVFDVPLDRIREVHAGLEGDWSQSATVIWSRGRGRTGFGAVADQHASHRPSLELYLEDGWVGLPCLNW